MKDFVCKRCGIRQYGYVTNNDCLCQTCYTEINNSSLFEEDDDDYDFGYDTSFEDNDYYDGDMAI